MKQTTVYTVQTETEDGVVFYRTYCDKYYAEKVFQREVNRIVDGCVSIMPVVKPGPK